MLWQFESFRQPTHDAAELETALAAKPDYIALGPIYETKLKAMKWGPQGLERITAWKRRVGALPLCCIGGITPERAPGVVAAGADSVAVITDFFTHADPEARVKAWLGWVRLGPMVRPVVCNGIYLGALVGGLAVVGRLAKSRLDS